jgi:hypothetical protein
VSRHEALTKERGALLGLQVAAAYYAADRSKASLEALGRAALRWHQAADAVLDTVIRETQGRDMNAQDRKDVDRVVPSLRIVRDE